MKEKELRKRAECDVCGEKIGHTGLPLFWTVKIERFGLNLNVIKRQDGLAAMLGGNSHLAQVMGTDEEMTTPIMDPVDITICEECAFEKSQPIALFVPELE